MNSYNYQKPGSFNDTLKDFHDLNPQNVQKAPFDPKEPTKEVYHGQIGDDTLIARNTSKENYPTLELQRENFDSLKIRYK